MSDSPSPISPALSRELVGLARRIEDLGVLAESEGKRVFALEELPGGEPVAVSIPGESEEVAGIHFYAGVRGIDFLIHLQNDFYGEDEGRDAMMRLHSWAVDFEEFRFLEPEDVTFLLVAGETPSPGSDRHWPVFRSAAPGELPWLCGAEEASRLRALLQDAYDALVAAKADPSLIAWDYLGVSPPDRAKGAPSREEVPGEEITTDKVVDFFHENAMELDFAVGRKLHEDSIVRYPLWRIVDRVGQFVREDFDLPAISPGQIELSDATKASFGSLMEEPGAGCWEIGRRLGVPVGELHSRYYHTEILAIRSQVDGRILAAELGKFVDRPRLLGRLLKRVVFEADHLPDAIRSDDEELLALLDPFGEDFGVTIEGGECPELDQELDLLVQRMLGS